MGRNLKFMLLLRHQLLKFMKNFKNKNDGHTRVSGRSFRSYYMLKHHNFLINSTIQSLIFKLKVKPFRR